jgi:hypothetical protein
MSTKQSSPLKPSVDTELPSLPKIERLSPLQFPTFQQLVEEDRASQQVASSPTPKKLNDLFDGMLGDLTPLLTDYQDHPEKYGAETHDLLEQLTHGSKSLEQLSTMERTLLNRATFDFFQAVPKKPEVPTAPAVEEKDDVLDELEKTAEAELDGDTDMLRDDEANEFAGIADAKKPEAPIPGVDVPTTELPAYWWLR